MPPDISNLHQSLPPLEIKAGSITLPILKLFTQDTAELRQYLAQKLARAPAFFRHAPVILDLSELQGSSSALDFSALTEILRDYDLTPVGVRGGSTELQNAARAARLAILSNLKPDPPTVTAPKAAMAPGKDHLTRLITQPVRSGQRIYAAGTDLIVLAHISPGAEVMADGNIHVYGSLRGRALAGVQGNLEARIYCSDLQAELVAIGGHYKISENLDESLRGRPVQVFLKDGMLIIDRLH